MANILTAAEGAVVLRCEATDTNMLQLLPMIDKYIEQGTGRDWTADSPIRDEAKSAARMLLVRWHEDPGGMAAGETLGPGFRACMTQLEWLAEYLKTSLIPTESLALAGMFPADGEDEVSISANMILIFNHKMASGATSAVTLATAAGAAVTVTNSLDATTKILTVNPNSNLSVSTSYVLTITEAADVYGSTLTDTISFRTED